MQAAALADEWAAANLEACHDSGRLWVVLGDGASLGLGASTRETRSTSALGRRGAGPPTAPRGGWSTSPADGAEIDDVLTGSCPSSRR